MEQYKATASFFLDKRKIKSDDKFPLKLTIYYKSQKKRYGINIDLKEAEWVKINSARLKDDSLKDIRILLQGIIAKAEIIFSKISPFSFHEFEKQFFVDSKETSQPTLKRLFEEYCDNLERQGRIGTLISYRTTLNSLLSFKGDVHIQEIDQKYLENYETHMQKEGKSPSTTGIYLRQLRAIVNKAINDDVIKKDNYPFRKYNIPASRNIKKSLTDLQVKQLLDYTTEDTSKRKALDFWLLSYLCNGMNMVDILHLKPENINGSFMNFMRQKTIRTKKKDLRPIKVALHSRAVEIINKYKNKVLGNPYLFPVLTSQMQPKTIKNTTQRFIKFINSEMKIVCRDLGIEADCGTYAARHSFSTILMRRGVSTQYIKESLGHSSVATTENYLADFNDETKIINTNLLTA